MRSPQGLIIANFIINKINSRVIIDTGATGSFIPEQSIVISNLSCIPEPTSQIVEVAGDQNLKLNAIVNLDIRPENIHYVTRCPFYIIENANNLFNYNAIIGLDIIKELQISVELQNTIMVAKIGNLVIDGQLPVIQSEILGIVANSPHEQLANEYEDIFAEMAKQL